MKLRIFDELKNAWFEIVIPLSGCNYVYILDDSDQLLKAFYFEKLG